MPRYVVPQTTHTVSQRKVGERRWPVGGVKNPNLSRITNPESLNPNPSTRTGLNPITTRATSSRIAIRDSPEEVQ